MGVFTFASVVTILVLLNFGTLFTSLACPECPPLPPSFPTKPPPYTPKPPKVHPPHIPKPPPVVPVAPPHVPQPPAVVPPTTPCPPPPYVPRPCPSGCGPSPKPPSKQPTCPIDTLKLEACVDALGVVHAVVGSAKSTCCPVLGNLSGLDAALCLCTTIKAKLLNIKVVLPIALELLIECGKTPPKGFQCPA